MKKIFLLSLMLVGLTSMALAQFYVRAGGGYGFPMATESVGEKNLEKSTTIGNNYEYSNTSENVKASYGAGLNFNIGAGYMISRYIGVEIDFSYLAGKKIETSDIYRYQSDNFFAKDEVIETTKSKSLFISPSFIITPGVDTKVPYGRFGIVMGIPSMEAVSEGYDDTDGLETYEFTYEYTGGLSFGFQGAVGMNWVLNNYINLVTEINFTSMSYSPEQMELTKVIYNGDNQDLDQLPLYLRKTEFKKKVTNESEPDINKPRQALRESKPFSSLALQVGVVYIIGGRSIE